MWFSPRILLWAKYQACGGRGDIFGGGRHDLTEKMAEFGGDAKGWGKGVPDDDCPSRCGWGMMGNGCLWWAGCDSRVDYGEQLQHGDVVGVQLDLDVGTLRYAVNGADLGVAFGPPGSGAKVVVEPACWGRPTRTSMETAAVLSPGNVSVLFSPPRELRLFPAVSIFAHGTAVAVRSFGIGGGTLQMPWLHDLLKTVASLAGRMSGALIAGRPTILEEEELAPWLDTPLLLGGLRVAEDPRIVQRLTWHYEDNSCGNEEEIYPRMYDDSSEGADLRKIVEPFATLTEDIVRASEDPFALEPGGGASICLWLDCKIPDQMRQVKIMRSRIPKSHASAWTPAKEALDSMKGVAQRERMLFAANMALRFRR